MEKETSVLKEVWPGCDWMIEEVIVVEGKDDIAAVKAAVNAECIMTHGHGISERTLLEIERAYERRGIIILTDPDYAGKRIRAIVGERVPGAKHAYLPRRLAEKGGDIGVENARPEAIRQALFQARPTLSERRSTFTKEDMLTYGLDAAPGAKERRILLAEALGIGYGNAKQLLAKLNDYDIARDTFERAMREILFAEQSGGQHG